MPPESLHATMERERKTAFPYSVTKKIQYFRDYARGKQSATLTTEQRRVLIGILGHEFSDNICRKILSVATGRTELLRWSCEDDAVEEWLMDDLWLKNRYNTMQSQISHNTLRDGNHCVGIRIHVPLDPTTRKPTPGAAGRIQLTHEPWWDGKTGIFVKYDDYSNVIYAVKEWMEVFEGGRKFLRRTFYFPHEIRRFVKQENGWQPYAAPEDEEVSPPQRGVIPWTRNDGSPLGIPIVHFSSVQREDGVPYGISHLDGGVLAFQDQINSLQYDLTAAAMYAGYQMTWSTGTSLQTDSEGNRVPPKVGPGQHWHADEATAKIGVLQSGDVAAIKDSHRLKTQAVCRMTDTPLHFITGEWPSGEALLRAEIDLVEFVRRFVENIGPSHTEVAHRATEIYNAFLGGDLNEDMPITSRFADPQRRDRLTMSQIATMEEKYTSIQERLRVTGRTDAEITRIMEEMEQQKQADMELATKALEAEADINNVGSEDSDGTEPNAGVESPQPARPDQR
jgi:hypothetical protein